MRNVHWLTAGLFTGIASLAAGPPLAPWACARAALASSAAPAYASGRGPTTQSGPAAAKDGVQVAVVRQSCSQTVEPDLPGSDLVETIVEVEVRNATSAPIVVHRDRFQLGVPGEGGIRTSTWFARDLRSVEPGQGRTFKLRFMSRSGLTCSGEMVLDAPLAIEKGTEAVKLEQIRVLPARRASIDRHVGGAGESPPSL